MRDEAAGMDWAKNLLLVLSKMTMNKPLGRYWDEVQGEN
jgi:hypothetical protein